MTLIAVVSQKGGVGKSTLARLVSREYAAAGWTVKIADLDVSQATAYNWQQRRLENNLEPYIPVEKFASLDQALKMNGHFDMLVVDCPPNSNASTLRIAERSHLVCLPTGLSIDDLQPAVLLAHELAKKGIPKARLVFVLSRVGDSELEIAEAREYIHGAGYATLAGSIPERVSYRRASDQGKALNETGKLSLDARSNEVLQSLIAIQQGEKHAQKQSEARPTPAA